MLAVSGKTRSFLEKLAQNGMMMDAGSVPGLALAEDMILLFRHQ